MGKAARIRRERAEGKRERTPLLRRNAKLEERIAFNSRAYDEIALGGAGHGTPTRVLAMIDWGFELADLVGSYRAWQA